MEETPRPPRLHRGLKVYWGGSEWFVHDVLSVGEYEGEQFIRLQLSPMRRPAKDAKGCLYVLVGLAALALMWAGIIWAARAAIKLFTG